MSDIETEDEDTGLRESDRRKDYFCSQHRDNLDRISRNAENAGKARTTSEVAAGRVLIMLWGFGIFIVAALTFMGTTSNSITKMGKQVATMVTSNSINRRYLELHEAQQDSMVALCRRDIEIIKSGKIGGH